MRIGYTIRASRVMVGHPVQGVERLRGRRDRYQDRRALEATGLSARALYGVAKDWAERLHAALDLPWPCPEVAEFGRLWDRVVADLTEAGAHVGVASYGRWNDGDRAFGEAIWCLVAHLHPATVIETGVAHGLTSRVILEGLNRNGRGHLWSVDLPAVDSALHPEIGMAVREDLRSRWTYVQGTAREKLPDLLGQLGAIDMFVHDSLHTGRNQLFEMESAWAALRPGGAAVIDDIDHSLAFHTFVNQAEPRVWLTALHDIGPGLVGPDGLWGLVLRSSKASEPVSAADGRRHEPLPGLQHATARAARLRDIEANPFYRSLRALMTRSTVRDRRHGQTELSVAREIAVLIGELEITGGRLLQIQPPEGPEILLFRDQLDQAARPVIYDQADRRDPDLRAATDLEEVDFEAVTLPASDNYFDLVVWNRELVTLKNAMPALREVRRIIRPGGFLVLAIPNLAALHNRLLLLAGRQPTTLHINNGDHVRGFAAPALSDVLEHDLKFRIEHQVGVGIAPVTSVLLPRPLRDLGHTAIWVLRKPGEQNRSRAASRPTRHTAHRSAGSARYHHPLR